MDYRKKLIVEPGSAVQLGDIDPAYHGEHETHEAALADLQKEVERLTHLQYVLYAEKKHALLIVLQGIDAAGKDGTCWHVMSAMNPQGTKVTGFKQPTEEERAHSSCGASTRTRRLSARSQCSTGPTTRMFWSCACTSWCRRTSGRRAST